MIARKSTSSYFQPWLSAILTALAAFIASISAIAHAACALMNAAACSGVMSAPVLERLDRAKLARDETMDGSSSTSRDRPRHTFEDDLAPLPTDDLQRWMRLDEDIDRVADDHCARRHIEPAAVAAGKDAQVDDRSLAIPYRHVE